MKLNKYLIIAIVAILAVGFQSCGEKSNANGNAKADLTVSVANVKMENQPEMLSFSGKIEAK